MASRSKEKKKPEPEKVVTVIEVTKEVLTPKVLLPFLLLDRVPIHHVRFHYPVPPAKDKEPVGEFKLSSESSKYVVESLTWTPHGVIYQAYGETAIVSLANVVYCRVTV